MKTIGWVAAAGSLMVLVACGGGGSSGAGDAGVVERAAPVRISGVVARGAALVEAKVSARTLGATITLANIASAQVRVGSTLKLMGVDPAPITDVLAQPLVAASAVQRGNAHDKVLDALAESMRGAGAKLADLVGLVTSRSRTLEQGTAQAEAAQSASLDGQ